jgi:hypothetical protein
LALSIGALIEKTVGEGKENMMGKVGEPVRQMRLLDGAVHED